MGLPAEPLHPRMLTKQKGHVGEALERPLDRPAHAADLSPRAAAGDLPDDVHDREGVLYLVYLLDLVDLLCDGEVAFKDSLDGTPLAVVPILAEKESEGDVVVRFFFYLGSGRVLQGTSPFLDGLSCQIVPPSIEGAILRSTRSRSALSVIFSPLGLKAALKASAI